MPTTVKVAAGDVTDFPTPALVVNLFQGVTQPAGGTGAVDRALDGAISALIADGEIKGKLGEITMLHTMGRIPAKRVVVAGLGKSGDFDTAAVRRVSGDVARFLRRKGVSEFATIAHGAGIGGLDAGESAQAIAEGTLLGLYKFDTYRSPPQADNGSDPSEGSADKDGISNVTIVERDATNIAALTGGVSVGTLLAESTMLARDLVNHPANVMTPARMAETAREVAEAVGLELDVMDRDRMKAHGMGAFLGVAQGSEEPPKLIVLTYRGDPEHPENNLGLVGKGITFDTGGISLKPAANMEAMKGDMAGGASVIAAMRAIGSLKPRINVTGLIAATENMPGGRAQRPGDVVTAMNGKTIEVINTDAEGRLVLADTMCYARSLGITRMVDVATLTGAMVVTLGKACTGMMGNSAKLAKQLNTAGDRSGERFWELPMLEDYRELIRSDVADMKNSGGRQAGSITAAMLLREFAEDTEWVHLDIAGTSTASSAKGHLVKGATGVPTRTLAQLALNLANGG
ncbi:MAG: leucyl aminopeptidase [Dehalococcoidia bacterium]|nr:leucyl aminopeptidase [Dehalococcoidia bacterium]